MTPTTYQKPEIRDANDNIIQQGAFGKNTALANATNDGWIDYVANDLEFLYDLAKDEVVPVPSLPASGQLNKTYLLTTTGVSYRWSGTEWVSVSSSEAVGRAESAALLAEQWATKTDGSVDGTEYSAKYYAEQAEQSADDAQDVADDMADHLVQIDKNTGGVAKNSKRISNIEKLLQGNLYDYDTDDDVAYVKDVPSGALPYVGIETLGGKTLVWNQLVQNGNFADGTSGWSVTTSGNIISASNGELSISHNTTPTAFYMLGVNMPSITFVKDHKILISLEAWSPYETNVVVQNNTAFGGMKEVIANVYENTWTRGSAIITIKDNYTGAPYLAPYTGYSSFSANEVWKIRNVMLVDLTLMFGAGNEPSTVAEFEAMFPASYYPYNAGTLLSAGVTGVKSVGVNRLDIMHPWYYGNSFYNLSVGAKISGNSPTITITDNGDGSFSIPIGTGWYGVIYLVPIDDFATNAYKFKTTLTGSNNRTTFYVLDKDYTVLYKYNDTSSTQNWNTLAGGANTAFPQTKYIAIGMGQTSAGTIVVTNPFVAHSTITEYTPYKETTMPIPAEVRALEGYGWSAGTAYNYVDFERKVFVKRVGRVVVTSADVPAADSDYIGTSTISGTDYVWIRNFKYSLGGGFADRRVGGYSGVAKTGTVVINNTSFMASQYRTFFTVANRDALLTAIGDGMDLYYELATPVETDISQYLTDNLIEVGAGGTITFPNANGDDYHIPVPSTETYMIDLQSAIGE